MPVQTLNSPSKSWPSAADGVAVTPGAAFANGSWVELTASTSSAAILLGLALQCPNQANVTVEVDIGVGAGGAEVVRTTHVACSGNDFGGGYGSPRNPIFVIPLDNIANGVRVAARMRGSNAAAWDVTAIYVDKPISGTILTTANPQLILPSAAAGTSITAGNGVFTNSGYIEMSPSIGSDIIIVGLAACVVGLGQGKAEFDIAVGAAASEVVRTTARFSLSFQGGPGGVFQFKNPLDNITSGSRISIRHRNATANLGALVKLIYLEKPI